MDIKTNLCSNAMRKVALLITEASRLGMDISGCGTADENPNSGNVYLWLEDYQFCLYIGLGDDSIWASWSNPEDGEEHEMEVDGHSLWALNNWCEALQLAAQGDAE